MAKVRLLTGMAGIAFSHNRGDVIDCNEAEAARFIASGIAEAVDAPKASRAVKKTKTEKAIRDV